jgi:COMPASS component SWD3
MPLHNFTYIMGRSPTLSQIQQYRALLNVSATASAAEIKVAYRNLAKTWHPDRYSDLKAKAEAEAKIKEINVAYESLKLDIAEAPTVKPSPETASKSSVHNPEDLLDRAIQYILKHRYKDALFDLDRVLKLSPDHPKALEQRAIAHGNLGSEELALRDRVRAQLIRERAQRDAWKTKQAEAYARGVNTASTKPPSKPQSAPKSPAAKVYLSETPVENTWEVIQRIFVEPESSQGSFCWAVSRRKAILATIHNSRTIHLWNTKNGKCFAQMAQSQASIAHLAFTDDEQFLISAEPSGSIKVWDLANASLLREFRHNAAISHIAIAPNNRLIAAGQNGNLEFWNIHTGKLELDFNAYSSSICTMALSDDGKTLATSSSNNQIGLWQYPFSPTKLTLPAWESLTMQLISDGSQNWFGVNALGFVTHWLHNGKIQEFLRSHSQSIRQIALHPDRRHLAIAIDQGIRIFDRQTQNIVADLHAHNKPISKLQFSQSGNQLISADSSGNIIFWAAS